MSCKPTYKGVRYNSLEELYKANGVNPQQKQQAENISDFDNSSAVQKYVALSSAINGTLGKGVYSNTMKIGAYINYLQNDKMLLGNETIDFSNESFSQISGEKLTWFNFDTYVNLAIDNINEQVLWHFNLNKATISAHAASILIGMENKTISKDNPVTYAQALFSQPVIKMLNTYSYEELRTLFGESNSDKVNTEMLLSDLKYTDTVSAIINNEDSFDIEDNVSVELIDDEIVVQVSENSTPAELKIEKEKSAKSRAEFIQRQAKVLDEFKKLDDLAKTLTPFIDGIDSIQGMPRDYEFTQRRLANYNEFSKFMEGVNLEEKVPHIAAANNVVKKLDLAIRSSLAVYSDNFNSLIKKLEKTLNFGRGETTDEKLANVERARDEVIKFMVSQLAMKTLDLDLRPEKVMRKVNGKEVEVELSGIEVFNSRFFDLVNKLKRLEPNNLFLASLSLDKVPDPDSPGKYNHSITVGQGLNFDSRDILEAEEAFKKLTNYEVVNKRLLKKVSNPTLDKNGLSEFQKMFATYSALNNGLLFATSRNYNMLLPGEIFKEFGDTFDKELILGLPANFETNNNLFEYLRLNIAVSNPSVVSSEAKRFSQANNGSLGTDSTFDRYSSKQIFYDAKITAPSAPQIVSRVSFKEGKSKITLYAKIAQRAETDQEKVHYYRTVGSTSSLTAYELMPDNWKMDDAYNPHLMPKWVKSTRDQSVQLTEKEAGLLSNGDLLQLVPFNDRVSRESAVVKRIKVIENTKTDDKITYTAYFEKGAVPKKDQPKPISIEEVVAEGKKAQKAEAKRQEQRALEQDFDFEEVSKEEIARIDETLRKNFESLGFNVTINYFNDALTPNSVDIEGNNVTITVNQLRKDTLPHEYSHVFIELLGVDHPAVKRTIEQAKEDYPELWNRINVIYSDRDVETQEKELLATVMGRKDDSVWSRSIFGMKSLAKLKYQIKRLFRAIARKLGIRIDEAQALFDDMYSGTFSEIRKKQNMDVDTWFAEEIKSFQQRPLSNKLQSLVDEGNKYTVATDANGKEENYYTHAEKPFVFRRITDTVNGFTSAFRKNRAEVSMSRAERYAKRIFKKVAEGDAIMVDGMEKLGKLTKEQYIEEYEKRQETPTLRGKIIHLLWHQKMQIDPSDEIQNKLDAFAYRMGELDEDYNLDNERWIQAETDIIDNIKNRIGLLDSDHIATEVTVGSDLLGFASTLDTLVHHPPYIDPITKKTEEDFYSMYDMKTGTSLYTKFTNALMIYGDRGNEDITENPIDQAKLEVVVRALMMRLNNPDVKFRELGIIYARNAAIAKSDQVLDVIDSRDYLLLIKNALKDKDLIKDLNKVVLDADGKSPFPSGQVKTVPEDALKQMLERVPDLFDASAYNNKMFSSPEVVNELQNAGDAREQAINTLQANILRELEGYVNRVTPLSYSEQKRVANLFTELQAIRATAGQMPYVLPGEDIGVMKAKFQPFADISADAAQIYFRLLTQTRLEFYEERDEKINEFNKLLSKMLKRKGYSSTTGFWDKYIKSMKIGNYENIYGEMFKTDTDTGEERLIHPEDEEFTKLPKEEQDILAYYDKVGEELIWGNASYLNEIVIPGGDGRRTMTRIQLYNETTTKGGTGLNVPIKLYRGWFPKATMEIEERVGKEEKESGKKATVDRYLMHWIYQERNQLERNDVSETQQVGIPLRYMGSRRKYASGRNYTINLAKIFSQGMINDILFKKYMDPVYAAARGLEITLDTATDEVGNTRYPNMIKSLKAQMINDLTNVKSDRNSKMMSRKIFGHSLEDWLQALQRVTSFTMMGWKPWRAAGNGADALIKIFMRAGGSKISRLLGNENNREIVTRNIFSGISEATKVNIALAYGKERSNKLYLLTRKFNFLTDDFRRAYKNQDVLLELNRIYGDTTFGGHKITEDFISYVFVAASLKSMKNLQTGKSIFDSYDVEEDAQGEPRLVWKGGIRGHMIEGVSGVDKAVPVEGLINIEASSIKKLFAKEQGNYTDESAIFMQAAQWDGLFIQMKRFLPNWIVETFGPRQYDARVGELRKTGRKLPNGEDIIDFVGTFNEGRLSVLMKHMLTVQRYIPFLKGRANRAYYYKNMAEEDKTTLMIASTTVVYFALMSIMFAMIGWDDRKKDPAIKFLRRYLLDNPTQSVNPWEMVRNAKYAFSPAVLSTLVNMADGTMTIMISGATYIRGNRAKALNDYGELIGIRNLRRSLPLISAYYDFIGLMESTNGLLSESEENEFFKVNAPRMTKAY